MLAIESDKGAFRRLHEAFKEALIHDLSADDFADMYAQTITYGLLSARVSRPAGLVADNLVDMVPSTNPFLKELLGTFLKIGGRDTSRADTQANAIDFDELGINEVVELLRRANMEAVLRDFGNRNPTEDPVIHFYELFLKEYDPVKRMKRGVFYTPRPVVSFIVRSVHEILRNEFGLADGLADTTTWGEFVQSYAFRRDNGKAITPEGVTLNIPAGVSPDAPFVQILDPATGTGTFLVETIDVIYRTLTEKWRKASKSDAQIRELWNDYVPKHLLPRLYGFELMMAPYSIAHMKIGLKLRETNYSFLSSERARIYLTNTLEEPKDFAGYFAQMAPALAHEAAEANTIKRHTPITVVIGNPPYSQAAGRRTFFVSAAFERYRSHVAGERRSGPLSNDYVRFIARAQDALERTNTGVIGMITSSSFLNSIIHRGMRYELLSCFAQLHCLNLHGESLPGRHGHEGRSGGPTNVFDIQEGVAVTIGARQLNHESGNLHYAEIKGSRNEKYSFLADNLISNLNCLKLNPSQDIGWIFSNVTLGSSSDIAGISFSDIFARYTTGITTFRDHFATAFSRNELEERILSTMGLVNDPESFAKKFNLENGRGLNISTFLTRLSCEQEHERDVQGYLVAPFDHRFIWYRTDLLGAARAEVASNLLRPNLAILTTRQTKEEFGAFVTRLLPSHKCIAKYDGTYFAPLYIEQIEQNGLFGNGRKPNLTEEFLSNLATTLNSPRDNERFPLGLMPEDVFHYIYAVFHSPAYRTRYSEFLKIDFPRVSLTSDRTLFRNLCQLGANLVALHLLEDDYAAASWNDKTNVGAGLVPARDLPNATWAGTSPAPTTNPLAADAVRFHDAGSLQVAKGFPKYADGKVHINPASYFDGVTEAVWNFYIGGYQVAHKWLKDRRERSLAPEDIRHYTRTCHALAATVEHMRLIDETIAAHGGFPLVGSQSSSNARLPFAL